jgi:hypothetical protein
MATLVSEDAGNPFSVSGVSTVANTAEIDWENSFHAKSILSWNSMDTANWLAHNGFEKYAKKAIEVGASGRAILSFFRSESHKAKNLNNKRSFFREWLDWDSSPLDIPTADAVVIKDIFSRRYRQVTLRIYDVTGGLKPWQEKAVLAINVAARSWIGGAYHVGVEVYGKEWAFGGGGVYWTNPKQEVMGHAFRESVIMPHTGMDPSEVPSADGGSLLEPKEVSMLCEEALSPMWVGSSYDLIHRNCCHFADVLCSKLGVGTIPKWINRVARGASSVDASVKSFKSLFLTGFGSSTTRSRAGSRTNPSTVDDSRAEGYDALDTDLVSIANGMLSAGKISRNEYAKMIETHKRLLGSE